VPCDAVEADVTGDAGVAVVAGDACVAGVTCDSGDAVVPGMNGRCGWFACVVC
jgi:hypothetical protein